MRGAKSVDIRKLAVVGVILLIILVGQAEGKQNMNIEGDFNMSLFLTDAWGTGRCGGEGEAGNCHIPGTDTISVTWTGGPGDTDLNFGEQIDINFTIDVQTLRSNTKDDTFACLLMNSTSRTVTDAPMDPEEEGWIIDTDAVGGTLGYNLVTPYTAENGQLGLHYCNWTVTAPSTSGTYELMGMARWSSLGPIKRNTSVIFTVSSGIPEFPPINPLANVLPIILPLGIYLLFRKSMPIEMPYSRV